MAKPNVRVSDWWFLCRHAGLTILLLVIGIGSAGAWMAGKGFGYEIPQWATPIVAIVATGMGAWSGRCLFLECAPILEFGDQFKFRMLFGGGTRKWTNVKSVTLIWVTSASDDQRLYRTVEVKLKGGNGW